mgnify:CR=1 FL=1|jgi:hypothetical protein
MLRTNSVILKIWPSRNVWMLMVEVSAHRHKLFTLVGELAREPTWACLRSYEDLLRRFENHEDGDPFLTREYVEQQTLGLNSLGFGNFWAPPLPDVMTCWLPREF